MLCEVCTPIFGKDQSPYIYGEHQQNLGALQKAMQGGCYLCSQLWERVISLKGFTLRLDCFLPKGIIYVARGLHQGSSQSGVDFYYRGMPLLCFDILPFTETSPLTKHPLSQSTSSNESLEQAYTWLRHCHENHSNCHVSETRKWLPKRLIFVGNKESGQDARLCESEFLNKDIHYITLSHCWGQRPVFCVKSENFQAMKRTITVTELPKNFQDAISVARKLGVEYMWIDSMCIIQDSREDWLQQSAHMCSIYKYALCNIAATGFMDGETGLFTLRTPNLVMPHMITLHWTEQSNLGKDPPANGKPCYLVRRDFWRADVSRAPLNSRSWVLQERLLSPRTIHFGSRQLFWECRRLIASETFPNGIPAQLRIEDNPKCYNLPRFTQTLGPLTKPELKRHLYENWHEIVRLYTISNLTYSSDKLVAISGLARELRHLLDDDQYLAGLWKNNLAYDLLWSVAGANLSGSRSTLLSAEYRAPTWSWASIDAPIWYPFPSILYSSQNAVTRLRILEARTTPQGKDQTMAVTAGYLRVDGLLKKAYVRATLAKVLPCLILNTDRWIMGNSRINSQIHIHYDFRGHGRLKSTSRGLPDLDPFASITDEPARPIDGVIYCLPIQSLETESSVDHFGLALVPTCTKAEFRRIGVYRNTSCESDGDIWGQPARDIEEAYYHTSNGLGWYTIDII